MRVYSVSLCKDACPYICDKIEDVIASIDAELRDSDIGNEISVKVVEMDEEKFNSLPEWTGP